LRNSLRERKEKLGFKAKEENEREKFYYGLALRKSLAEEIGVIKIFT
jgi:hypothetical protein